LGIKIKIIQNDLPLDYQKYKLIESKNGATDTVYFLDDKYVLKIFENSTKESVDNELKLLKLCKVLKISQVIQKIFYIQNKPTLIYKKSEGINLKVSTKNSIVQIAKFIKQFHIITKNKTNSNIQLFDKNRLKDMILTTKNKKFLDIFNSIDIEFQNDGIIHGDIFLDNCSFKNDKLQCVYDFADACVGDFVFDLAVIAQSWCKNDDDVLLLLNSYGYGKGVQRFKNYMKYALLYYSVNRS
jgi:homoserine kinase type II